MQNAISPPRDIASRIAAATAARRRRPDYTAEVRALLEAARKVIDETGRARVADIVAEAGLSNDTFYRHFRSKDELVAALSEDTTARIAVSLRRRMAGVEEPEAKVRVWLDGMLEQARGSKAQKSVAVLNASSRLNTGIPTGDHARVRGPLAELLEAPFAEIGSPNPAFDAELVTHAVGDRVAGHLWAGTSPSREEAEYLLRFCTSTAKHRGPKDGNRA